MRAVHTFWSRPSRTVNYGRVRFEDFELLTMMLSALEWRQLNGPIVMVTDEPGARYFDTAGVTGLWDEVRRDLECVPEDIDPYLFWAAGKLYALGGAPCPCVMLDTDMVIWKRLEFPETLDVVAAHQEALYPDVYPDMGQFARREGYRFPAEWDQGLPAANTAFLYVRDGGFRDYYVKSAVEFMHGVLGDGLGPTSAMCCAEQRLLPMCAKAGGQRLGFLISLDRAEEQDFVTHVWGHKRGLREHEELRRDFCRRCVERLLRDFPGCVEMLKGNEALARYLPEGA